MIKFGTSGWRDLLADGFTFPNVRLVSRAIAAHLKNSGETGEVLVGYDNRFLSREFAQETCRILLESGLKPLLSDEGIATPILSFECLRRKGGAIINFTASHNPFEYNGIKFSPKSAGPALPEQSKSIEREIVRLSTVAGSCSPSTQESPKGISLKKAYFKRLESLLDTEKIKKGKLKVLFSPLFGAGINTVDHFLTQLDLAKVTTIHGNLDPYFDRRHPEPIPHSLPEFKTLLGKENFHLGCSTDGDADRFGIFDRGGAFIDANTFIPLLADYLIGVKGFKGDLARSLATSHILDRVASFYKRELHETPVGFKYIGDLISKGQLAIGGEESAGLTIGGHVPEKDGILACLLACEMVAVQKKSLSDQLTDFYKKYGKLFNTRLNLRVNPKIMEEIKEKIKKPELLLKGETFLKTDTRDGLKITLAPEEWILVRLSGTEPLVRLYGESTSSKGLKKSLEWGKKVLGLD